MKTQCMIATKRLGNKNKIRLLDCKKSFKEIINNIWKWQIKKIVKLTKLKIIFSKFTMIKLEIYRKI